jgi:hypothetical protein
MVTVPAHILRGVHPAATRHAHGYFIFFRGIAFLAAFFGIAFLAAIFLPAAFLPYINVTP